MAINLSHGAFVRGASTITQQLAKNLFLSRTKTLGRKLEEASLALLLDSALGKRRVLEIYLNVIEWGPGSTACGPRRGTTSARSRSSSRRSRSASSSR